MGNVIATTIYPFIIFWNGAQPNDVDLNHEEIHIEQEKELFLIGFYLYYLYCFTANFIYLLTKKKKYGLTLPIISYLAYEYIPAEQEAFFNEYNINYIKTRKKYSFLEYKGSCKKAYS